MKTFNEYLLENTNRKLTINDFLEEDAEIDESAILVGSVAAIGISIIAMGVVAELYDLGVIKSRNMKNTHMCDIVDCALCGANCESKDKAFSKEELAKVNKFIEHYRIVSNTLANNYRKLKDVDFINSISDIDNFDKEEFRNVLEEIKNKISESEFNTILQNLNEMKNVSKSFNENTLKKLSNAFKNFYKRLENGEIKKIKKELKEQHEINEIKNFMEEYCKAKLSDEEVEIIKEAKKSKFVNRFEKYSSNRNDLTDEVQEKLHNKKLKDLYNNDTIKTIFSHKYLRGKKLTYLIALCLGELRNMNYDKNEKIEIIEILIAAVINMRDCENGLNCYDLSSDYEEYHKVYHNSYNDGYKRWPNGVPKYNYGGYDIDPGGYCWADGEFYSPGQRP